MKTKEWLKDFRNQLGLTQRQFAEKLGLSYFTIQNIERGERTGSDETWEKILKLYEESKKNSIYIESIDSEEIIEKINQDIIDLDENAVCYIFYKTENGKTEFVDCIPQSFITEKIINEYFEQDIFFIESKLKYAKKLFELQDDPLNG